MHLGAQLRLGQLWVAAGALVHMHVELRRGSGEQQSGLGGSEPLHRIKVQGGPRVCPHGAEERVQEQQPGLEHRPVLLGLLSHHHLGGKLEKTQGGQSVEKAVSLQAFSMREKCTGREAGEKGTLQEPGGRATYTRREDPFLQQCCSRTAHY